MKPRGWFRNSAQSLDELHHLPCGLYDTLYATNYDNGTWYTVDTATGELTLIPGFSTPNTAPNYYGARDLGGSSCIPVPNADTCTTTYAPLQTTFTASGVGIKKGGQGSAKPGQSVRLTTKLTSNKRVAGVVALDSMRVYTYVPAGVTVRKVKPEPTASVPVTRGSGEGTMYWWDLALGVGKTMRSCKKSILYMR